MMLLRKTLIPFFTFAALIIVAWASQVRSSRFPPQPIVISEVNSQFSEQSCAECHAEIVESFQLAPHANTLHRAVSDELLARFVDRTFVRESTQAEYRYVLKEGRLFLKTSAYPREMPIDWIVGSGTHAQTPLLLWEDDQGAHQSLEHIVSWYPNGELGVTLGQEKLDFAEGIYAVGHPWDTAETINCFGCHATYVPVKDKKIDFEKIHLGISCARCHLDSAGHVQRMEAGADVEIERFSKLSPLEAMNRCGECHRRATEVGSDITPNDETIVRFAPVGLAMSPCFLNQVQVVLGNGEPARLDCTTCHNPHRPATADWKAHTKTCLKCHDERNQRALDCTHAARDSNCLTCHMPKVSANEHLQFTDHWIRIREPAK